MKDNHFSKIHHNIDFWCRNADCKNSMLLVVIVNYCFTSLLGTNGHSSDIVIRYGVLLQIHGDKGRQFENVCTPMYSKHT